LPGPAGAAREQRGPRRSGAGRPREPGHHDRDGAAVTVRPGAEVTGMSGPAALPRRNGELVFEAPWQGRVFGMALARVDRLVVPWAEFQRRVIAEVAAPPDGACYH